MIDVVMPVWAIDHETIEVTDSAIESLKGTGRTIVVDNGSTVGGGWLREHADLYVRNKENLGYAKAVNQGLKLSGDLVAVANNDIRVSPNWLEVTESVMSDPAVGTLHFRMIRYTEPMKLGTEVYPTGRERWCTGSFFVMRNKWLFDEKYLNSYEDWDLQTRVRSEGYKTAYTTRACYQHLDSYTQKKVGSREENNQRNREYFKSKHGEYPEDMYLRQFPDQMAQDWRSMFDQL